MISSLLDHITLILKVKIETLIHLDTTTSTVDFSK